MRERYPSCVVGQDHREIIESSDIDAVAIAAPAASHGDLVQMALDAGKDVFVEKPLCLQIAQARALAQQARACDLVLMVGHLLWYHPAITELQRLVSDGALGQLRYIYSNRSTGGGCVKRRTCFGRSHLTTYP